MYGAIGRNYSKCTVLAVCPFGIMAMVESTGIFGNGAGGKHQLVAESVCDWGPCGSVFSCGVKTRSPKQLVSFERAFSSLVYCVTSGVTVFKSIAVCDYRLGVWSLKWI